MKEHCIFDSHNDTLLCSDHFMVNSLPGRGWVPLGSGLCMSSDRLWTCGARTSNMTPDLFNYFFSSLLNYRSLGLHWEKPRLGEVRHTPATFMCRWTAIVVRLFKANAQDVSCSCKYVLMQDVIPTTPQLVSFTQPWRHKLLYRTVSQLAALYIDCAVVLNIFVAILLPGGLFCTVNDFRK